MGVETKIQWCDHTFNPWVGCTKVSPGCANCYAEADMDKRRHFAKWGDHGTRVMTSSTNWKKPLKWNRDAQRDDVKRVVFCSSLADVFEDWTGPIINSKGQTIYLHLCGHLQTKPGECAGCGVGNTHPASMSGLRSLLFFDLIFQTPNLIWRVLTKRPENIKRFWTFQSDHESFLKLDNVQIYTSVENQEQAEQRIPELLKCRDLVPVLGISAEPLLEQIDLRQWLAPDKINHVIVGGESGPNARPFCSLWAGSLMIQCFNARVPFFMKQFGSNPFYTSHESKSNLICFVDSKGGDIDEWPEPFQVRQLPENYTEVSG